MVAGGRGFGHLRLHLLAVVAMERVAFDDRGLDALAPEDVLEGPGNGRRAGARGTGDRDHGMPLRHGRPPANQLVNVTAPNSERSLNSGEENSTSPRSCSA